MCSEALKYKLYYFDTRGVAEGIRMLFHYAGQPFEDIRISQADWPNMKKKFPFEKLPVLELNDGRMLAESNAIARYLGIKFGLTGKDDWERAKIDEAVDILKDFHAEIVPFFAVKMGRKTGNLEELKISVLEPAIKKYLPLYVKILDNSKSGYIVPSGLTYGDFVVVNFLSNMKTLGQPELDEKLYPSELNLYIERVHGQKELSKYIAARK